MLTRLVRLAALALALAAPCAASAQEPLRLSPLISLTDQAYGKPSAKYQWIYDELRKRKVLEVLRDFTPLRVPRAIRVVVSECNGKETVPYKSGAPVTICYELIDRVADIAMKFSPNNAAKREALIVSGFIQAALHDIAIAIFDILDVPVWGRVDDAADRLAALVMVSFSEEISKTVLTNNLILFEVSAVLDRVWTGSDFASDKGPAAQRFFNYACVAIGADFQNFGGLTQNKGGFTRARSDANNPWTMVPRSRANSCVGQNSEYRSILAAFNLRIMPYVDPDLLIKVRATNWLAWAPSE